MGKAALIAVAAFTIMGAMYSFSSKENRLTTEERVAEYQHEVLARNAAEVGHQRARQALAENFDAATSFTGEYNSIPYSAAISRTGNTATIEATGVVNAGQPDEMSFRIRSVYERVLLPPEGIAAEPPKFMRYAVLAEGALDLGGNLDVILTRGDRRNKLNANVHSNTKLSARGNSTVEGFGTSAGPINITGNVKFTPSSDTGAEPTQAYVDRVEIPPFDAAQFVRDMVGDTCFSNPASCANRFRMTSNLDVTGNEDIAGLSGTRDEPFVWYVTGNQLKVSGNVDISGYVLFVAENGFKITGNVKIGETDYDGPVESNVGFYTGKAGVIDLKGNATLSGQFFAGEGVDIKGNVDVFGSVTTGGWVDLSGNATINYRAASPALTGPWQEPEEQIRLIAYNEW